MAELRAGFARRDITQPVGSPASLSLFATVDEIWDPLSATALVLESGGTRVAIVGLDLCGLLEASHRGIRQAVQAATGISADRVVLNVSHSHSAPYLSAELQTLLRPHGLRLMDDAYADDVTAAVAAAVTEAADRTVPVSVGVGRGTVERVASSRRPKTPDGATHSRYGRPVEPFLRDLPEGLIDPEVAVVRFDGGDSRPVGALLSYACHPTAAGGSINRFASADFIGHGRALVERELGFPCVFLQGCGGNVGTGKWIAGTNREDTAAMGERFARGVVEGLASMRRLEAGSLAVASASLALELERFPPLENLEGRFEQSIAGRDFGTIVALGDRLVIARRFDELRRARLIAVTLGELALVVLAGEVFLEHGLAIRAGSPFGETIVAAYDDNTPQYIPTAAAFSEGAYEVDGGWRYIRLGEGERLSEAATALLERLSARSPA